MNRRATLQAHHFSLALPLQKEAAMSLRRGVCSRVVLFQVLFFVALWIGVRPALAQTAAAEPPEDAKVRPMEPDFKIINLPTTLPLPIKGMNFGLTHRFAGNLRDGSFADQLINMFGLDEGAIIGLQFNYGFARGAQASVFRTNFDKTIQFSGKWDAVRQTASRPVAISGMASIEGSDNFHKRYAPALGAIIAHNHHDRIAVYATPFWIHNTAAEAGVDRDTFLFGVGGRARILETVYLVAEVSPRLAGYAPGDPEYGFGIEKRVGGHTFQLNFTNTFATTFGQLARGGFPDTLYLGFNLARRFY